MKEQIQEIFKSKDLKEISIELVEKVLDDQITDEIVKELPILKSIVAVKNVYNSYTDRIFIKKAMNVLLELGDLNEDEKITSSLNFVVHLELASISLLCINNT
jgi:hypothetical protein